MSTLRQVARTNSLLKKVLPTMYDLPSEEVGEAGMPDEFHPIQALLLRETFRPSKVPLNKVFSAVDMNLYYDVTHTKWYKRPDWFGVVGVSKFYKEQDLRLSYVVWDEKVTPLIVVELLSPGTEDEDLERSLRLITSPPAKWEVYERILKIPYYVVFDGHENIIKIFVLVDGKYEETGKDYLWIESIGCGLKMWDGVHDGMKRVWLRWYDSDGNLIPSSAELRELDYKRAEYFASKLRELGEDPDKLLQSFKQF